MKPSNRTIEFIGFSIGLALLLIINQLSMMLFFIAAPLLFAFFTYRNGLSRGLVFSLIAPLIVLFVDGALWLLTVTLCAPVGLVYGHGLSGKRSIKGEKVIFGALLVALIGMFVAGAVINVLTDQSELLTTINQSIDQVEIPQSLIDDFLGSQSSISEGDIARAVFEIRHLMTTLIPSLIVITAFVYVVIIYLAFSALLKVTGNQGPSFVKVKDFQLPGNPVTGTTLIIFAALIMSWLFAELSEAIIMNTLNIVLFIFAIQGFAFVVYLIDRNKAAFFIKILLFIVAVLVLQVIGLGVIGWLDAALGIRQRMDRSSDSD